MLQFLLTAVQIADCHTTCIADQQAAANWHSERKTLCFAVMLLFIMHLSNRVQYIFISVYAVNHGISAGNTGYLAPFFALLSLGNCSDLMS